MAANICSLDLELEADVRQCLPSISNEEVFRLVSYLQLKGVTYSTNLKNQDQQDTVENAKIIKDEKQKADEIALKKNEIAEIGRRKLALAYYKAKKQLEIAHLKDEECTFQFLVGTEADERFDNKVNTIQGGWLLISLIFGVIFGGIYWGTLGICAGATVGFILGLAGAFSCNVVAEIMKRMKQAEVEKPKPGEEKIDRRLTTSFFPADT